MSGYDPQGLTTTLETLLVELPTMIDVQMDQCNRGGDPKPQKKAGRPGVAMSISIAHIFTNISPCISNVG